jgi:hypothetical protein
MAWYFRREWVHAQCATDGAWTAVQRLRHRRVARNAALWYLLKGCVDAFLIFCYNLLLRHGYVGCYEVVYTTIGELDFRVDTDAWSLGCSGTDRSRLSGYCPCTC